MKNKTKQQQKFNQPKDFGMLIFGIISVLYILNITFGVVEFLPDNIPIIGNIDEALATGVFIAVLQYFGVDITHFLKRK